MKMILFDRNPDVCIALEETFAGMSDVEVQLVEDLDELPYADVIVAPGNSFGVMTGGLDLRLREAFGQDVQDSIQHYIMSTGNPLPVGQAITVKLESLNIAKHLIYAPTMYIPRGAVALDICGAMWAAVYAALESDFQDVLVPGLGTGAGQMHPALAACAMRAGYDAALAIRECQKKVQQELQQ